jgi:formylglycine-generating enzyme required for sulfatase activity
MNHRIASRLITIFGLIMIFTLILPSGVSQSAGLLETTAEPQIVINEVMFYPSPGEYEWVELKNTSDASINIGGYALTDEDNHWFEFPSITPDVPPGAFVVVIYDGLGPTYNEYDFDDNVVFLHTSIYNYVFDDNVDQVSLYDDYIRNTNKPNTLPPQIISFVAWGDDPGVDATNAVSAGLWIDGTFVNIDLIVPNYSLGLIRGTTSFYFDDYVTYLTYQVTQGAENTFPFGNKIYIPAGEFQMGCDPLHNDGITCSSGELPLHTVYLDTYLIDATEVTNAQYAQCVTARACTAPDHSDSSTRSSYYDNPEYADYPVIYVNWYKAQDYCTWAGGSLPTEAQWEKAARGSTDTRAFPWGDASPDCTLANFEDRYGTGDYCVGDTSAVGSYPTGASLYGLLDMAGNVDEWVNDWYSGTYYSTSPYDNPTGPDTGTVKVLRGGGWLSLEIYLRVASRYGDGPMFTSLGRGFRCAASSSIINSPPYAPSNPSPVDAATGQSIESTLSWTGSDPDGDVVLYDVYFEAGDNTPDILVSNDQSVTTYNPGTLNNSTQYYWQIVAQDEHGVVTIGPIWDFTTSVLNPTERIYIPAGEFHMGCHPLHNGGYSCYDAELPLHTIYLDAYLIDTTEVTNIMYAQCVATGACTAPYSSSSRTRTSYYGNPEYSDYPVIWVDWYQANNYCTWAGGNLPTEAQWEKAARGSSDTRAFPWGDAFPDCSLVNFIDVYGTGESCVGDTSAVGSYPSGASLYGPLDMAGNVWEWVHDWYSSTYYSTLPYDNPTGPDTGTYKVLRGGSWQVIDYDLRVGRRFFNFPTVENHVFGFRCAYPPGR